MISFVDKQGYNAINTTILDFRMTSEKDNIYNKDTFFEYGRKPTHFRQVKTWKKCEDIDLATSAGHMATFENRKIYPLKIINKHYPLRNIEQATTKIFKDRLPRYKKEARKRGWHTQYDIIKQEKDFIYKKKNLNVFNNKSLDHYTYELIIGEGIDKL